MIIASTAYKGIPVHAVTNNVVEDGVLCIDINNYKILCGGISCADCHFCLVNCTNSLSSAEVQRLFPTVKATHPEYFV